MVGYGCIRSDAKDVLEKLITTWQIPFVSTMDAKGYISEDNPLSLGIVGTSGDVGANDYFHESKAVLAVGNSFAVIPFPESYRIGSVFAKTPHN